MPLGSAGRILYLYSRMAAPARRAQPLLGGAQKRVLEMAAHFRRQGWSVSLASDDSGTGTAMEEIRRCGIQHVTVPFRGGLTKVLACLRGMRRFLRQEDIQIVHSNDRWTAMFGCLASARTRARHVYTARNVFHNKMISRVFLPAHIVAVSHAVRDNLIRDFGVAPSVIEVVYDGIDISPSEESDRQVLRQHWGLQTSDRIVAFVGNLMEAKGLPYLLNAVSEVVQRVPRLRVLLVGDGRLKESLCEQVRRLNLQETVLFCGAQAEVAPFLDVCEFTVMPSLWEGLGNSAIESLLLGKPVVATSVGGLPEVVEDGASGRVVPPRDSQALAEAILFLLEHPLKAQEMGRRGRRTAADKFAASHMLSQYERYYERILHAGAGDSPFHPGCPGRSPGFVLESQTHGSN